MAKKEVRQTFRVMRSFDFLNEGDEFSVIEDEWVRRMRRTGLVRLVGQAEVNEKAEAPDGQGTDQAIEG